VDGVPAASLLRGVGWHHGDHYADVVNCADRVVNYTERVVIHTDREYHDSDPDPDDLEVGWLTGSPVFPKPPTADPVGV
jgi:hypothetical protein